MGSVIPNESIIDAVNNTSVPKNELPNAKQKFFYPINSFETDGLIAHSASRGGGPYGSREKCEKEMFSRLNKISKKFPNVKWETDTLESIGADSMPEEHLVIYIRRPDGTLQSQNSCLEVKAP